MRRDSEKRRKSGRGNYDGERGGVSTAIEVAEGGGGGASPLDSMEEG